MTGETPKKEIPGYRFVIINKLPNGDTEHIYEKVATPTTNVITSWIDGNVHYIFRKVATPKAQVKRLVNTGSEINNIAEVGFGALLAGIAATIRKRRKEGVDTKVLNFNKVYMITHIRSGLLISKFAL